MDQDFFPNEIGVILYNTGNEPFEVKKGERIAQGIIANYNLAVNDEIMDHDRNGGFGSTGR